MRLWIYLDILIFINLTNLEKQKLFKHYNAEFRKTKIKIWNGLVYANYQYLIN